MTIREVGPDDVDRLVELLSARPPNESRKWLLGDENGGIQRVLFRFQLHVALTDGLALVDDADRALGGRNQPLTPRVWNRRPARSADVRTDQIGSTLYPSVPVAVQQRISALAEQEYVLIPPFPVLLLSLGEADGPSKELVRELRVRADRPLCAVGTTEDLRKLGSFGFERIAAYPRRRGQAPALESWILAE